jgi:hypothetical protein
MRHAGPPFALALFKGFDGELLVLHSRRMACGRKGMLAIAWPIRGESVISKRPLMVNGFRVYRASARYIRRVTRRRFNRITAMNRTVLSYSNSRGRPDAAPANGRAPAGDDEASTPASHR